MKKKLLQIAAIVTVMTGSTLALVSNGSPVVESQDKTPLEIQVDNHEERIDGLETKTDGIQADVAETQSTVTILQQRNSPAPASTPTSEAPASPVSSQEPTPAPAPTPTPEPSPAPTPEPLPTPNKLTITAIEDIPKSASLHTCAYTLYDGRTPRVIQPATLACQQVGELLTGVNGY